MLKNSLHKISTKYRSLISLSLVFMARGGAALGAIGLSLIVGKIYGVKVLGQFTVFVSFVGVFTLLSRRGLDMILTREISKDEGLGRENGIPCLAQASVKNALYTAFILAILGSVLLKSGLWGEQIKYTWIAFIFTVPSLTVLVVISGYYRGTKKVWLFPLMQIGGVSFLVSVSLILIYYFGIEGEGGALVIAFSVASAVSCLLGMAALLRENKVSGEFVVRDFLIPRWKDLSINGSQIAFTLIGLSRYIIAAGSFIIVAPVMSEIELGFIRVSERLGLVVSFAVLVINPFISARFARLIQVRKLEDIYKTLLKASVTGAILAMPPLLMLLINPHFVLGLMGDEFLGAERFVRILALSNFIIVLLGPFSVILNMGGGEKTLSYLSISFMVFSLIIYPVSSITWGGAGFVWSYALVSILYALFVMFLALRHIFSIRKSAIVETI